LEEAILRMAQTKDELFVTLRPFVQHFSNIPQRNSLAVSMLSQAAILTEQFFADKRVFLASRIDAHHRYNISCGT
jgi:hypothetical protein